VTPALGDIAIAPMEQDEAESIAAWRYDPPYDFYDWAADAEDLAELLDPVRRRDRYYAARDADANLIGFYGLDRRGDVAVVGLGLRPDLTGRGFGLEFLQAGLRFAQTRLEPSRYQLAVAEFNRRAIKVYERAGFVRTRTFSHETNGGVFRFVELERPA
jgi:[ribosomal protein S18]-alanine N-acetyltransferase